MQREKHIRLVGYGAMVTEMLVALMAIIAACALQPGQYFAINTPADPGNPASLVAAVKKVNDAGFPITSAEMEQLSREMGEPTLIGKTGGAPTFAVGMASMFDTVFKKFGMGHGLLDLWYHFAIMFEALFILTTLDAGTRVGRFILQDLLGHFYAPLGDTSSWFSNILASASLVAGWGYFLYQGAIDPDGIAKSLWPIFGIANQLLAVIAFCLGTTVIIKMGRTKYAWCTLVPLCFLVVVTFSAGLIKIFAAAPLGFLASAKKAAELGEQPRVVFNNYLDAGVAGMFLIMVTIIVTGCAMEWRRILSGQKKAVLQEGPYVALAADAA